MTRYSVKPIDFGVKKGQQSMLKSRVVLHIFQSELIYCFQTLYYALLNQT